MSVLDYHPFIGPFREAKNHSALSDPNNIAAYTYTCSVCDHTPIDESMTNCPACGEPIDWDQDPINGLDDSSTSSLEG